MFLSERGFAKLRGRKIKPATYNLDLNLVRGIPKALTGGPPEGPPGADAKCS